MKVYQHIVKLMEGFKEQLAVNQGEASRTIKVNYVRENLLRRGIGLMVEESFPIVIGVKLDIDKSTPNHLVFLTPVVTFIVEASPGYKDSFTATKFISGPVGQAAREQLSKALTKEIV